MSGQFDPYHVWLGIPPKDQPPHHYRLLGLEAFESHPDVIDAAANRHTTYLRGMSTGDHRRESQQILTEIAAARRCLLDPVKKQQYDAELRTRLDAAGTTVRQVSQMEETSPFQIRTDDSATPAVAPARSSAVKAPAAAATMTVDPESTTVSLARRRPQARPYWQQPWVHLVCGVVLLVMAIVLYLKNRVPEEMQVSPDEALNRDGSFFDK
jgi:hypothetical protein